MDDVAASGAQAYVAGELGHHDALRAARLGVTALCTLHSNTERLALAPLGRRLREMLPGIEVRVSEVDADPFRVE